jgi:hypothetical protein
MSRFKQDIGIRKKSYFKDASANFIYAQKYDDIGYSSKYDVDIKELEKYKETAVNLSKQLNKAIELAANFNSRLFNIPAMAAAAPIMIKLENALKEALFGVNKFTTFVNSVLTSKLTTEQMAALTKKMGPIKNQVAHLGPMFSVLNVFMGAQGLNSADKKLTELKKLQRGEIKTDGFYTKEEQIKNLQTEIIFDLTRFMNSIAYFIPATTAIAQVMDFVLMILDPQNVRNLAFKMTGFKGGEEEAKRIWELSKQSRFKDLGKSGKMSTWNANNISDKKVSEIIVLANIKLESNLSFVNIKSYNLQNYVNDLKKSISDPKDKIIFQNWLSTPEADIVIGENLLDLKAKINNNKKLMRANYDVYAEKLKKLKIELDKMAASPAKNEKLTEARKLKNELIFLYDENFRNKAKS